MSRVNNLNIDQFKRVFSDFLQFCDDEDVAVLYDELSPLVCKGEKECLIEEGEYSNVLYLVYSGVLSVSLTGEFYEISLGLIKPGQWVGDVSLIEPGKASATVKVVEQAHLLCLKHDRFEVFRSQHPKTASRMLHALSTELAGRLRHSSQAAWQLDYAQQPTVKNVSAGPSHSYKSNKSWLKDLGSRMFNELSISQIEQQLEAKQRELEKTYEYLYQQKQQVLLEQERERILAELHDGVGGHLVAMLSMLDNREVTHDEIRHSVRAALDDLRMMIDSLDSIDGDIPVVLGMFRSRVESRLQAQGIKFDWRVVDLPPVARLGPHEMLQILRILQEAVTNITKHSGADTIVVSTRYHEEKSQVEIEVSDNGCGMPEQVNGGGYGRNNMLQRARALGAQLEVSGLKQGVCVTLAIPLLNH